MSDVFVVNASLVNIDFDRAQAMMDHALAAESAQWVTKNADVLVSNGVASQEQAMFDNYCRRHMEYFGEPFAPDVMSSPF